MDVISGSARSPEAGDGVKRAGRGDWVPSQSNEMRLGVWGARIV